MPPVASVAISGDLIVFSVIPPGNGGYTDLWGLRLSNPQPFVISNAPGDQLWPDVQNNFVVWSDSRSGDFDIYGMYVPEPTSARSWEWPSSAYCTAVAFDDGSPGDFRLRKVAVNFRG